MLCIIIVSLAKPSHASQASHAMPFRTYEIPAVVGRGNRSRLTIRVPQAKVISLVDIWRRGHTFPSKIAELESICRQSTTSERMSKPYRPVLLLILTMLQR